MAKIYNAPAQLLFCSLNLLFGDVLVAAIVGVCLSSLKSEQCPSINLPSYIISEETKYRYVLKSKVIRTK